MGHLSPFTEPSDERYSSALFGRLPELLTGDDGGCLDVNLGEKRAAIEFFLGRLSDVGVAGVGVSDAANDDGVSIVVAPESGVKGVNKDETDNCFSFRSRE